VTARRTRALPPAVVALTLVACATTTIKESWTDPAAGRLEFRKVLALVLSSDASLRRIGEDELVRQIRRTQAVAAYTVLSAEDYGDVERAKATLRTAGFDGVVTMRLVGKEQRQTWVPGGAYPAPSYASFGGYYRYAWPSVYDPGYLRTDTIAQVETQVYSLADDKLLWAGLSETVNPSDARSLIDDVARAVAKELKKQGLVE
jgi:hypothetical protein